MRPSNLLLFISSFLIKCILSLENHMYQPSESVPNQGYLSGTNLLFPSVAQTRGLKQLSMGQSIIMYLRFIKYEGSLKTFTTVFFPAVDDYSQLSIPNSNLDFNGAFLILRLESYEYIRFRKKLYEYQFDTILFRTSF